MAAFSEDPRVGGTQVSLIVLSWDYMVFLEDFGNFGTPISRALAGFWAGRQPSDILQYLSYAI